LVAALVASAVAMGQVGFECPAPGPLPTDPALNCEGVASDNQVAATGVVSAVTCGFPTAGAQYLMIMSAGGSLSVPSGGPIARPLAAVASEVRIPIPAGAASVSFDWEFFNAETVAATYNDGISVDVVDVAGALVGNLVYADTFSGEGACTAVAGSQETLPAGPQSFVGVLPAYPACAYISIAVWNGTDNAVASRAFVDNVSFDSAVPGCGVPCFAPTASLTFSSPSGLGCVQINMGGLPAGGTYFFAVSLDTSTGGWLYGVNISIPDLVNQITFGYPFWGPIPVGGCGGNVQLGEFCGLPSGLSVRAVALGLPGVGLNGPITANTPAVTYTIP
jgi:hypothetical protein